MGTSKGKRRYDFLIDIDLFKRVRLQAVHEDKTINSFIENAIILYLNECEKNEK